MFNDLIGKKFEYGGRGPNSYDCYGLTMEVCKRFGIKIKEFYDTIDQPSIINDLINDGKSDYIKIENPEPLCLVLFKVNGKYVTHIGVVLSDCQNFIHVLPKREVVIERLNSIIWKNRIHGYYKHVPIN